MISNVETIKNCFNGLKSQREELDKCMETLTKFLYPYKQNAELNMWDTTGSEACIKLSSLLSSLITPQGQKWHELVEPSFAYQAFLNDGSPKIKKVRSWCEQVTDTLFSFRERSGSGFVSCLQTFYASIVEFGTGCFYLEHDFDENGVKEGIRYIAVPLSCVYLNVNHQNVVDSVYRKFEFTAEQIVRKWGKKVLSSQMRASLDRKENNKFKFIHAVYPKTHAEKKKEKNGKNFHSKFLCVDDNKFFEEDQLRTLPYVFGRYRVRANEIYGKSPAMEALPAIRRLNEISNELAQHSLLSIKPPLLGTAGAQQVTLQLKANEVTYGGMSKEGKPLFYPLRTGDASPYHNEQIRLKESINSLFFLDLFQVLDDKASRSATESMEKTREKGAFVGPIIGSLQSEFIGMMIKRELDILDEQHRIPELDNYEHSSVQLLKVEYTSPLFKYQQAESLSAVHQGTNYVIELAIKTSDPSCMDNVDLDKASRFGLRASGVPAFIMRDNEEVAKYRETRNAQMKKMQEQQSAAEMNKTSYEQGSKLANEVISDKLKNEIKRGMDA